jgi:tetratricopeptide (TPR) repeat protein
MLRFSLYFKVEYWKKDKLFFRVPHLKTAVFHGLYSSEETMFRKAYYSFVLLACAVIICGTTVFGQTTGATSGTVEMDGTKAPVAGALVEAYRTDVKLAPLTTKTSKSGDFTFAGLLLGAEYALAVSGPGIAPAVYAGVKAGQDRIIISVSAGDGHKFTADEARKYAASPAKGGETEMSADEKKARAELEAKNAEITAKNEKIKKSHEIVVASLMAGNEAFKAKNYDLAIAKYDEGIAADPDYAGSAPQLNNNRAAAITNRAIETRNKAITATDTTEKIEGLSQARKALADAASGYLRSWNLLINAPASEITDRANYEATKLAALQGSKDTFRTAVRLEQVDPPLIDAAKVLVPEYLKTETDASKKTEASLIIADLYRVAGDSDNAIVAYRAVLETSPDNLDALAGAGFSLINNGYIKVENGKSSNNKALQDEGKKDLQEGSNLLGKFASAAPDTHKFKADALALIDTLKKEQNVTPQKVATPVRKRS